MPTRNQSADAARPAQRLMDQTPPTPHRVNGDSSHCGIVPPDARWSQPGKRWADGVTRISRRAEREAKRTRNRAAQTKSDSKSLHGAQAWISVENK